MIPQVPNYFIPFMILFTILQFLLPGSGKRGRWKQKGQVRVWLNNFLLSVLTVHTGLFTNIVLFQFFFKQGIYASPYVKALPPMVKIIIAMLAADFLGFLAHYLNHKISLGWKLHRIHHLDSHIDTLTSVKFHPLEMMLSTTCGFIGAYFAGLNVFQAIIVTNMISFFVVFTHADWRLPYRIEIILGSLVFTSGHHLLHHNADPNRPQVNYGIIFTFWDRLIGTYAPAEKETNYTYGIEEYHDADNGILRMLTLRLRSKKNKD